MEDFSVGELKVGEDPRKEEANGRGRTGSCRRPADHGDLLSVSDKRGNGGFGSTAVKCATRQRRLIRVGCASSSAMQTYNLPFYMFTRDWSEVREGGEKKQPYSRAQSINKCFFPRLLYLGVFLAFNVVLFKSKIQYILQRGVADLCSNDGGCSLFIVSLMAPAHCGCPSCDPATLNPSTPAICITFNSRKHTHLEPLKHRE